ncbi:hypothetical protein ACSXEK_15610 (plasmid) [Clostridium perfringens]
MIIADLILELNPEDIFAIISYKEDKYYNSLHGEYWQDFNERFGNIFNVYDEIKDLWVEYDEEKGNYKTIIELEREF